MTDYHSPLYPDCFYHIYNRGNSGDNIFYKPDNYNFFLKKYDYYLSDYLDTYCYCLLPNHFHLLARVKDFSNERIWLRKGENIITNAEDIVSELFRRLFTSYAKSINKQEVRHGSLFQKKFKRIEVKDDSYFSQLVFYIHANPQLHGISKDFSKYPYSSYQRILSDRKSKLCKQDVLEWFGGKDGYMSFHKAQYEFQKIKHLTLEE